MAGRRDESQKLCLAVLALLLAGCATPQAGRFRGVAAGMIFPEGVDRVVVQHNQVFLMPVALDNRLPEFPAAADGPTAMRSTVCVEFVVDSTGAVISVTPMAAQPGCDRIGSSASAALLQQTRLAVLQWSFIAAGICSFDVDESECDGPGARIAPMPVKLAYGFTFESSDGKHAVRRVRLR